MHYSSSSRRPSSQDVAREAGVSRATVSYVLNNRPHVSIPAETRERIHEAARKLGYRPNSSARALVTGRTGLISLWLWGEQFPGAYQAHVSHYMQVEMEQHAYQLMVHLTGRHTMELGAAKTFAPWSADGIISHEAAPAVLAHLGSERYKALPIVSTGAYNWLEEGDSVRIDLAEGAREAVQHLLASGRKRVVYLTDDLNRHTDQRSDQYEAVLREAGREPEFVGLARERITSGIRAIARQRVQTYIAEKGCPEAIFCHNDEIAIGAYRGLRDLKLRIPDDVALVGCDGIEDTEYLDAPLSTIIQPIQQMSALAWEFLKRRMNEPTCPRQEVTLTAHFVNRESSRS